MLIPKNAQSISTIPEETATEPGNVPQNIIRPQSSITDLMGLRAQFPFLPIMPFPSTVISAKLGAAGAPTEFQIPRLTKIMRFKGSAPYFVSNNGLAAIPAAPNVIGLQNVATPGGGMSILSPDDYYFYCTSLQTVSVVAVNADTYVSLACWIIETDLTI